MELKQPPKLKAAEKERMKKQTSCPPIMVQIAVNDDQEGEQEQLSPESNPANQRGLKELSKTPSKLSVDQQNVNIGHPLMLTRSSKTVKRNSQELYSQTDVVTDMPQVTKEHVPSPPKKKKKIFSKPSTLGAIINEEVYIDEPFSETPKLSLIAKEREKKTLELSELEKVQSVSVNQVVKDIPLLQKGKSVSDKTNSSLKYSYPSPIPETVSISESFEDEGKTSLSSPTTLNKIGEKKDNLKFISSETYPSEKIKEIQDSPSEPVTNSTECSLTFAGITPFNPSLMESRFDVR